MRATSSRRCWCDVVRPSTPADFWARVERGSGCWPFQGARTAPGWHGSVTYHGRRIVAHRLAWTLARGPIPAGLLVLHRCDNPPCCNPDHLYLGTQRENMRDAAAKGRTGPQLRDWSRCKRGHEMTAANTYIHPGHGRRLCRKCIRLRRRRYTDRLARALS